MGQEGWTKIGSRQTSMRTKHPKKGFLQLAREKVTKTKNKMSMSMSENVFIACFYANN